MTRPARTPSSLMRRAIIVVVVLVAGACTREVQAQARRRDAQCSGQPDDTFCDDGNPYTLNDKCVSESCQGTCARIIYQGECVQACPGNLVADAGQCKELANGCGNHCLECSGDGTCARCIFSKYLDGGKCSDTCRAKTDDGKPSFTTDIYPDPPGRYCDAAPESSGGISDGVLYGIIGGAVALVLIIVAVVAFLVIDRQRNRTAFQVPDAHAENAGVSAQPGSKSREDIELLELGHQRRMTATSASSAAAVSTFATAGEQASASPLKRNAWGSQRGRSGSTRSRSNSMRSVTSPVDGNVQLRYDPARAVSQRERDEWKRTLRKQARRSADLSAEELQPDPAAQHAIDTTPTRRLDEAERNPFFAKIDALRKDMKVFQLIFQDTKRKRSGRSDDEGRAKYEAIITDLYRFFHLMETSKSSDVVPYDAMRLLDWAKRTLDRYILQRARMTIADNPDGAATA